MPRPLTPQNKMDASQNMRGAITNILLTMDSICQWGTSSTKPLDDAIFSLNEAKKHIEGEYEGDATKEAV